MARYATRNQYEDMRRTCKGACDITLTDKMAVRIMNRLCKKYGMRPTPIKFRGYNGSGCSHYGYITMSHNPTFYLVIHEFSHEAQKRSAFFREKLAKIKNVGTDHHGLHFETVLNHVNQFCKASNYFEKMRNRTRRKKAVVEDSSPVKTDSPDLTVSSVTTSEVSQSKSTQMVFLTLDVAKVYETSK